MTRELVSALCGTGLENEQGHALRDLSLRVLPDCPGAFFAHRELSCPVILDTTRKPGLFRLMLITKLKGKIHRAAVTQAELDYMGSITIDEDLMDAAGIVEYERVEIADIDNGERFATYVIAGERASGLICLNGAAARCAALGDKVIIMAYASCTPDEAAGLDPKVVFVDSENSIVRVSNYEKHGLLRGMD